jgi:hypothetical protein
VIRRAAASLVLAACGPSVGVDDDGGDTTGGTTTSSQTSATSMTSASSATTATSQSTSVSTTDPSDESTSYGTVTGTDDAGFIQTPDGGVCLLHCSYCDVWAQDCSDGEKCVPWANDGGNAWNATRCSELDATPAAIGEPCVMQDSPTSGFDDCDLDGMCWEVDPTTLIGTCVAFCGNSRADPECAADHSCWIAFDGTISLCLPSCDPLAPTCAADETCAGQLGYSSGPSFVCLPAQFEPQPYAAGCDEFAVCDEGLFCVVAADVPGCTDPRCCTTLGESASPPMCPDATQTCIPIDDPMIPEGLCYCGVEV